MSAVILREIFPARERAAGFTADRPASGTSPAKLQETFPGREQALQFYDTHSRSGKIRCSNFEVKSKPKGNETREKISI